MKPETLNGEFISSCCGSRCLASCILKPIAGSFPHNLSFSIPALLGFDVRFVSITQLLVDKDVVLYVTPNS